MLKRYKIEKYILKTKKMLYNSEICIKKLYDFDL